MSDSLASHLLDEEDEKLGWDLPDDDIKVPQHLLPAYQDEDDETVLPSASHPSYPYGNPHQSRPLSTSTTSHPHPHPQPTLFHHPSSTHSTSLSTSLPTLELRQLFAMTSFGEPRERQWGEMGLEELIWQNETEDAVSGMGQGGGGGDAPPPAGQNAGDHPASDEEGDEGA